MKRALAATLIALVPLALFAAAPHQAQKDTAKRTDGQTRTGEQVFMETCSRCHQPPMTLAPRVTGTVIMHMRVRARLSQKDEQLLRKYLAP